MYFKSNSQEVNPLPQICKLRRMLCKSYFCNEYEWDVFHAGNYSLSIDS